MIDASASTYLQPGTRVLNTEDGEPGVIVNGFTKDTTTGEWTAYEVETAYGIEVWERSHVLPFSEMDEGQ